MKCFPVILLICIATHCAYAQNTQFGLSAQTGVSLLSPDVYDSDLFFFFDTRDVGWKQGIALSLQKEKWMFDLGGEYLAHNISGEFIYPSVPVTTTMKTRMVGFRFAAGYKWFRRERFFCTLGAETRGVVLRLMKQTYENAEGLGEFFQNPNGYEYKPETFRESLFLNLGAFTRFYYDLSKTGKSFAYAELSYGAMVKFNNIREGVPPEKIVPLATFNLGYSYYFGSRNEEQLPPEQL